MGFFRQRLRSARYDEIHISPHLDDSAYSCGGRIAELTRAGRKVLIVTLFGPGKELGSAVEGEGGRFLNYQQRWVEEQAAVDRLGADYVWLNYPEILFRKVGFKQGFRLVFPFLRTIPDSLHEKLCAVVLQLCEENLEPGGTIVFPFSVGFHPDHRIAFDVGRAVHSLGRFNVEFYEDVAYCYVPTFMDLRLKYLGVSAEVGILRTTREIDQFLHREANLRRVRLFFTWLYVMLLFAFRALHRGEDRLAGEGVPLRISRSIAKTIEDKLDAMHLYTSQTEYFFGTPEALRHGLLRDGTFHEHTWVFPPASSAEQRLPQHLLEAASTASTASSLHPDMV